MKYEWKYSVAFVEPETDGGNVELARRAKHCHIKSFVHFGCDSCRICLSYLDFRNMYSTFGLCETCCF